MDEIEKLFLNQSIDCVVNCIGFYSFNTSLYGDMLDSNMYYPFQVLNLCIKHQVKKFVTADTSLPRNTGWYSFSKGLLSKIGECLSSESEIVFIDLKMELFFGGQNEPDSRFLPMCRKKLRLNEIIALTDGVQKRDIVRMEDVVEIIIRVIQKTFDSGYYCLPIGRGEHKSIKEIVEIMKKY